MATGNFIHSEYGIFALPTLSEPDAAEYLREIGEDVTDEAVASVIRLHEENTWFEFPYNLEDALYHQGVTMAEYHDYFLCYDAEDRIIARVDLRPGYYSGMQVLAEGDPEEVLGYYYDEEAYLEEYSPDIEPVLNALREITVEYKVFARFSNGETWYTKREVIND